MIRSIKNKIAPKSKVPDKVIDKPKMPNTKVIDKPKIPKNRSEFTFAHKLKKIFATKPQNKKSRLLFDLKNLTVDDLESYEILSQYNVGDSRVFITKNAEGKVFYLISEPPIDNVGKAVYAKLMRYLYISLSSDLKEKSDAKEIIKKKIFELSKEIGIYRHATKIIDSLLYYVMRDSFGYGIINVPMADPNLEDILEENFTKPVGVVHKKFGEYGILDTNIKFNSTEAANSFVQKLVQRTGKSLTAAVPYIDSMTKDGHRIAATFGSEVSLPGANFTIRKFSDEPYTITKLIQMGTLSPMMAAYLWILLDSKAFILVIGSTAAGKTTTIGAISSLINPQMKIITIEDTPEA
ncbi:type II/IV secretion system ATPase subunit [Candidatus Nitrosotenuis chungbukensis]|uniref:type II/IV secretion system ATPase subunit n=1 Tax=Candidatus Nitrosotenuis chungbukensis TaxID=1353246 RepID=UPI002671C89B|nr:type II/IV secretion system ATPase subunit [Candidatus Nitrosotenuis chungbukensis]WKT57979.1 type II/IV secretion system ATPase subunit [Candidatus Nitrosotenuis chungbukensis]